MEKSLTVGALLLVSLAMALSLAHALELPGKLRLDREAYTTVQQIYYPGFTFGGLVGELGGMLALLTLLFIMPFKSERFWWTVAAFGLLVAVHAVYWLITHPVNNFWVEDVDMAGLGSTFFSLFSANQSTDWRHLRNVWEYSHVARAVLAMASLVSISIALTR